MAKRQWPWQPKFLLPNQFFLNQFQKIKCLIKQKKEKKKKEKKSLPLNTLNVDAQLNFAEGNGCKNERHQSEQKKQCPRKKWSTLPLP